MSNGQRVKLLDVSGCNDTPEAARHQVLFDSGMCSWFSEVVVRRPGHAHGAAASVRGSGRPGYARSNLDYGELYRSIAEKPTGALVAFVGIFLPANILVALAGPLYRGYGARRPSTVCSTA